MPENLWTFLLLTCVIGGAAAYATGRAIALTWRPFWQALAYMIPLTAAVRFLHYALFGEDILAAGPAFLAFLFLLAVAASRVPPHAGAADGSAISLRLQSRRAVCLACA